MKTNQSVEIAMEAPRRGAVVLLRYWEQLGKDDADLESRPRHDWVSRADRESEAAGDFDGRPKLDRPRDLGCRELTNWFEPSAAVTWDGNRFLVTATVVDGTPGLRGYIVDRDANVLAASDAVTGEPSAWDPAAVTTSNGAALLYSRISPEDGYVGRLFMRLAPTPQLRLRCVRR